MAAKLNEAIRQQEAERDRLRASHLSATSSGNHPATSSGAGTSSCGSGSGAGAPLLLVPPTPAPASALPLSPDASPGGASGNQRLASKPLAEWGEYFEEMLREEEEEAADREGEGGSSCGPGRFNCTGEGSFKLGLPMCSVAPEIGLLIVR